MLEELREKTQVCHTAIEQISEKFAQERESNPPVIVSAAVDTFSKLEQGFEGGGGEYVR